MSKIMKQKQKRTKSMSAVFKPWLVIVFFAISPLLGLAQTNAVRGVVVDGDKSPIPGVNVVVKGTTNGVATDIDGNFTLNVAPNSVLVFSYIGYQTKEVLITNQTNLTVVLEEEASSLDEVVVVGYGTLKKSDLTGAVVAVDAEDLASRNTTNVAEALQGAVPGVSVRKAGGLAGSGVSVKIRGVTTRGSNEPLYIIDGFIGDISTVNPNDIKSMNVMKDAAAAAIYGSVAANGVVIVETKGGSKGKIQVNIDSYVTLKRIDNQMDLLNCDEYIQMHKAMYQAAGQKLPAYITNPGDADTDWQDEVFRNGFSHTHSISVRGGSENINFGISANIEDEKGISIGNDYIGHNARMKVGIQKGIFDINANMAVTKKKTHSPQYSLKEVYMISPLVPAVDEHGEFGLTDWGGLPHNNNPLADQHYRKDNYVSEDFVANMSIKANFTKWLSFTTSYSYNSFNSRTNFHMAPYTSNPKSPVLYPYSSDSRSYWEQQLIDNILTFDKKFGGHSLTVMLGSSISTEKTNENAVSVEGKKVIYEVKDGELVTSELPAGFLDPNFPTINAGIGGTFDGSGTNSKYNRASFFGRINYSYKDRYLFQATLRNDGSSKFGSGERWGLFPSVALGWRITEESFFPETDVISNLKLRGSWGRLGNENALGKYDFLAKIYTYNTLWYGAVQGGAPWPSGIAVELANKNLKWETTTSTNVGLDYALFDNKLSGSIDYYQKVTSDLLIEKVIPLSSGIYNPTLNVGEMKNSGLEFVVNYRNEYRGFHYNVGFNLSTLKNRVKKLANPDQEIYGSGLKDAGKSHMVNRTIAGKAIASYYLYKTNGIFQSDEEAAQYVNDKGERLQPKAKAGDIRFVDIDGNGVIDADDKEFMGSGMPKVEANLSFNGEYKGFDLSVLVGSGWGNKLYNGNRVEYEAMSSGTNMLKSSLNYWREDNKNTDVPRAVLNDPNGNARESDRFLEDGDFIRIRQIQLGYSLPTHLLGKIGIDKLRFYVSLDNVYTWTNYSGIDPEFSNSLMRTGVDSYVYPFTKSYVFGLQLTF